jgi:broad specificity phosphatase PhoE
MGPVDMVLVRHGYSIFNQIHDELKRGNHSPAEWSRRRNLHPAWLPLTEPGKAEAARAGSWVAANLPPFDVYLRSPYRRARETTEHMDLPGASWKDEQRLKEQDLGDKAYALWRPGDPLNDRPGIGETMNEVIERARDLLGSLEREADGKRVIMVTHRNLMRAMHKVVLRLTDEQFVSLYTGPDIGHRIDRCGLVHYSRRHPRKKRIEREFEWWRTVSTTDLSRCDPSWRRINRPAGS